MAESVFPFIQEVRSLIGNPPAGLEFLEYLFAGVFLIFVVSSAIGLISAIFRFIGGGS